MKKVALVFVLAVFLPSLVLAWLAVRSLRDQQYALERQQTLLCQEVADGLAKDADNLLLSIQQDFGKQVEAILAEHKIQEVSTTFSQRIRTNWTMADIGFLVTLDGNILCPSPYSSPEERAFRANNSLFLCNVQSAEVYWNSAKTTLNRYGNNGGQQGGNFNQAQLTQNELQAPDVKNNVNLKSQIRNVVPQQQNYSPSFENNGQLYSKVSSSEAEFRQLVGDSTQGTVARFLENKLNVLVWYRAPNDPEMIFGAQLAMPRLKLELKSILLQLDPALKNEIAIALLDDNARPVAVSTDGFQANWKHPFAATEIGEALPHWEIAAYLINPAKLTESAHTLKLTLGLLIGVLVLAIGVGSWLIVSDLNRQLTLARQKTDFVSNVSHELKTPLTSIRMFAELLAEGRVQDTTKQRSYLNIITAETARLTRLINNVLDFSRMDRGEKKYNFQKTDLVGLTRELAETYRHHLEAHHFTFNCETPESPVHVNGDRDAIAQIIVNLLSNAEKYSGDQKEIIVKLEQQSEPLPYVEVQIADRGIGVPKGCEGRIFEQFYRAHDSLSSGIQGSGLGLTLARQIARAHGGDVVYRIREGGGSCFILRLPIMGT